MENFKRIEKYDSLFSPLHKQKGLFHFSPILLKTQKPSQNLLTKLCFMKNFSKKNIFTKNSVEKFNISMIHGSHYTFSPSGAGRLLFLESFPFKMSQPVWTITQLTLNIHSIYSQHTHKINL